MADSNETGGLVDAGGAKVPASDRDKEYPVAAIHMVRTATTANLMLSQMADQKASILMGATFVVFTIALGQADNGTYPLSSLWLAFSAFVSAMYSIAAVVPTFSAKPPPGTRPNILFFGVFAHMDEDEFVERVLEDARNEDRLLATMLRDIHQNGTVMQRKKFRYLARAYRIFQIGLVLTVLVFIYESRDAISAYLG